MCTVGDVGLSETCAVYQQATSTGVSRGTCVHFLPSCIHARQHIVHLIRNSFAIC